MKPPLILPLNLTSEVIMKKLLILLLFIFLISCESNDGVDPSQDHSTELLDLTIAHQEEKDDLLEKIESLNLKLEEAKDHESALQETIENLKGQIDAIPERDESTEESTSMDSEMVILSGDKDNFDFVMSEPSVPYAQRTYILGSGDFLDTMSGQDQRQDLHLGEGPEVASFHIYGSVYNFKWAGVTWDDNFSNYIKDPPKHLISKLSDTNVYIHTMIPEGLPYEVVSMENISGTAYDFLLSYDGYGLDGQITIIEE